MIRALALAISILICTQAWAEEPAATLHDCLNRAGISIRASEDGQLVRECEPDTLYTWGSPERIKSITEFLLKHNDWNVPWGIVFFARSPVSSHGYGYVSLRIKLKAGAHFQSFAAGVVDPSSVCKTATDAEKIKTVFIRTESNQSQFADFVICSPGVIHSASANTPEHYNELQKDYQQIKQDQNEADHYSGWQRLSAGFGGMWLAPIDYRDFSEGSFVLKLRMMQTEIDAGKSKIIFNPELNEDEKSEAQHFATKHPTYWNEK
jgi:hypothetical protein